MSKSKQGQGKQHYVPESILKNFSFFVKTSKEAKVFFIRKLKPIDDNGELIIHCDSVRNVCSEKSFYSYELLEKNNTDDVVKRRIMDYDISAFEKIDGTIAPIAKKFINDATLDTLTAQEKEHLDKYIVYQYYRSPAARNLAEDLSDGDQKHARRVQGETMEENRLDEVVNIVKSFRLRLIPANEDTKFIISDSPVLWSPTAEGIYFPISPNYCLCYQGIGIEIEPLDPICINELQYRAATQFIIADKEEILKNIWQNAYQKHIQEFSRIGSTFWKCILSGENYEECGKQFKESIYPDFQKYDESLD